MSDSCVTPSDSTPVSLLRRVKANERDAWFSFCELYTPLVYHWCYRADVPQADVEEVAQSVFARLVTAIHRFEKSAQNHRFRSWLWTVSRNLITDYWREKARLDGLAELDQTGQRRELAFAEIRLPDDADEATSADESAALVSRILDQIRPRYDERVWQAFWRVVVDEQPTADVARELGLTQNHVRQIKARMLRRLRQEFGELLD